ncbi:MAG TPA: tetratricopeptide repeat protein, partial [Tepidisphaeraceae bacterium]|nr:tetratricopeptide repeat protein [Tepidisphaeraceae bacterium]
MARIGRTDDALSHLRESVRLGPTYAEARNNLGLALHRARRYSDAIAELRAAVALRPNYAEAHHHLGNTLRAEGRAQEAAESHRRAISISPRFSAAYHELAADLCDLGLADEAIAAYRKVLELNPDSPSACSDVLFCLHYSDRYTPAELLKEAMGYGRKFDRTAAPERNGVAASFLQETSCDPVSLRRLRVGYLSPDFRRHTIRHIIEPILESHDRQRIEVFCYASVHQPDEVTAKLAGLSEHWTDVSGLPDDETAERIGSDNIDVLVDLAGHMGDTRLAVLARRPARVQLQLGYPGTTGLSAVDYRFADAHSMPSEAFGFYSEKTLYLPDCAWLYKPTDDAPDIGPLPAKTNGFVTFGCLNKMVKVSGRTLDLWAKVLEAVPNSRLMLLSPLKNDRLLDSLARRGVDLKRVELAPRRSRRAYLELFNRIDIALDPMP